MAALIKQLRLPDGAERACCTGTTSTTSSEIIEHGRAHRAPSTSSSPTRSTTAGRWLNRDQLLPTPRAAGARRGGHATRCRERIGNTMQIFFVVPDYYETRPKACMNGWGIGVPRPSRPTAPRCRATPRACCRDWTFPNVRDARRARDLVRLDRLQPLPRHGLDEGAVRAAARNATRTSAAAAARRTCSPAMRPMPIRCATRPRTTTWSPKRWRAPSRPPQQPPRAAREHVLKFRDHRISIPVTPETGARR